MNRDFSYASGVIGGIFVIVEEHCVRNLWNIDDLFRIDSFDSLENRFKCSWTTSPYYNSLHPNGSLFISPSEFKERVRRAYKNEEFRLKRLINNV